MSCPFQFMSTVLILCVSACVFVWEDQSTMCWCGWVWWDLCWVWMFLSSIPRSSTFQADASPTSDDCAQVACVTLRGWNDYICFFNLFTHENYFKFFFFHIYYFVLTQTTAYFQKKIILKCEMFSIFISNKYESLFLCTFNYKKKKSFWSV